MLDQVARQIPDSHPIHTRAPFVGLDLFQCLLEIVSLQHFFHQLFGYSQAFDGTVRHERFGPSADGARSFTPHLRPEVQFKLVILPLSVHEFRYLLATPFTPWQGNRSGLRRCRLLRPLLTSALRFERLTAPSVANPRHRGRPPEVSSTAFRAQLPDLRFASLMDTDFAVSWPLV